MSTLPKTQTFVFVGDTEVGARLSALLVQSGYTVAAGLSSADVVFTYHELQSGLEEVYFGSPGLLQDTKEGAILLDLSPTTPVFAQEVGVLAQVNNRFALDAPLVVRNISVDDVFASRNNLLICVGGSSDSFEAVRDMLFAIASEVLYLGVSGAGQSAKAALTLQNAASVIGAIEACASCALAGDLFDTEEVVDVMVDAGVLSPTQAAFIDAVHLENYTGTYTIEIMMAELSAAIAAADDKDTIFPQAEAGFHLLELLALVGGASLAPASLALIFGSEEKAQEYGLDWSRAEGAYAHDECCDHDHGECNDENHDHSHDSSKDFMGFSSN